jgi:AraC-like DNA-binding protein
VDRAKLVLTSDLARRWTLAEVAAEVGVSPVYLTQSFQQVEGVPLYRYQLRLRLARALELLADYDDLTRWRSTSASPATAISAPRSSRRTGARRRNSASPRCTGSDR